MKRNVVFVLGVERSGSTFLGNLIAQANEVNAIGELPHVHRNPESRKCGCGLLLKECPVWNGLAGNGDYITLAKLPLIMRNRSAFLYSFRFLRKLLLNNKSSMEYIDTYISAYDHFSNRTGSDVVVDTAKNFTIPYYLFSRADINLKVVFINRSAVGIEDSLSKRKVAGHKDYRFHNFLLTIIKWKVAKFYF